MLTPTERYDLVSRAIEERLTLGLLLVPITSGRAWLADGDAIYKAYNALADTIAALCREVDDSRPCSPLTLPSTTRGEEHR
jgi:hypothetical protein